MFHLNVGDDDDDV